MPIYVWLDKTTNKKTEILRDFKDYKDQPTAEEAELTEEEYKAADWVKEIGTGIRVTKGENWNTAKGYH